MTSGSGLARWWLNRSVLVKGLIAIAIPMLALLAVTVAALVLQLEEQNERQAAIRANNLITAAQSILLDAVDSETGIRGYAVSRDPSFLRPYEDAADRLNADLPRLLAAASTSIEQDQVAAVQRTLAERGDQLQALKAAIDAQAPEPELNELLRSGKTAMDELRQQIQTVTLEPSQLAAQARLDINRLESVITIVEIAGLVLGLLTGVAGIALFAGGISRRIERVVTNADRLGSGEPLLPDRPAGDEIGRLGASLVDAHTLLEVRLAQVSAARDEAVLATQAKNTFLSRTSHELRTPLNAILGFAQLLEMSDLSPDDVESAEHIHSAGRHLLALINELIDISRVESGDLQISVEPVSVSAVMTEIVSLMTPLAAARDIVIEQQRAKSALAVAADHQRLKQVLVNLVSNAVKYNRHGGHIWFGFDLDGNNVRFTVTDTGPGLTPAEIERIWLPFERLEAARHGIEGTGIGLPLALALTEAMHGTLTLQSTIDVGSTFVVTLPRARDLDLPDAPPKKRSTLLLTGGSTADSPLTVLSIEDNQANSDVLRRVFAGWPHVTLHTADNGTDGLALAQSLRPDVVLLDLHLPDLPGEDVFCRLRSEPETSRIPVVVLSADATAGTIRRLEARGAAAYLTKPLDLRELQRVLERITSAGTALATLHADSRAEATS